MKKARDESNKNSVCHFLWHTFACRQSYTKEHWYLKMATLGTRATINLQTDWASSRKEPH